MNRQQSGFTLIELIMVIVILGVLSAFAVPKFADLSGDAEEAAANGARGAIKSASGIAHAACLVDSACDPSATGQSVTLEGTAIVMEYGYPNADPGVNGILTAAGIDSNDFASDFTADPVLTITKGGCSFTYTEAANATTPPVFGAVSCP